MRKDQLLNLRNVIGYSEGADLWNGPDKITVFVKKKLKMSTIKKKIKNPDDPFTAKDLIPKVVKTGMLQEKPTDVIEIGDVKAQTDRNRYAPLQPGCEIGPRGLDWVGTAGMIVYAKKYGDNVFLKQASSFGRLLEKFGFVVERVPLILTNAHVVQVDPTVPERNMIVQPGVDGYLAGRTVYTEPISKTKRNEFDVSLIQVNTPVDSEIIKVGKVQGVRDVAKDEEVQKYGRTTRHTNGKCVARNVTMQIDFGPAGTVWFSGLDMYTCMSSKGDSGSAIVSAVDNHAVSLLFAGSSLATFGIPMKKIIDMLEVELGDE